MPKIKQVLCNSVLLIIGLIFSIIIAEIIAGKYLKESRLDEKIKYIEGDDQPDIGCYDKDLGWGFRFNPRIGERRITSDFDVVYSINSKGIRDREVSFEKPEKEFRIVALGESTVFGEGIDYGKRFTEIMEQALDNAEVINMGVRGFGMDQLFLRLQRDGFEYNSDLVVLFIIEDFLERCKNFIRYHKLKPRFVFDENKKKLILQDMDYVNSNFGSLCEPDSFLEKIDEFKYHFLKKSKLLILTDYHIKIKKTQEKQKKEDRSRWDDIHKRLSIEKRKEAKYSDEDFKKLIFMLLEKYKKACKEHNVDFLIVNIDNHKIDYIDDHCQNLDIFYVDLSAVLTRASIFKPLRFEIDPHYNKFAHRVIGEYISEYIKDRYNLGENKNYVYEFLGKF